jgi:predicted RNase H-like HicB family nuclease
MHTLDTYTALVSQNFGQWQVCFPDLNDMTCFGNDKAQALANARQDLTAYLAACRMEGESIPSPTAVQAGPGEEAVKVFPL